MRFYFYLLVPGCKHFKVKF